ncbi:MAG: hypothetical protein P4M11_10060 [Candidatus Pacebacteria bacterium]|nr:hypothetical protein [Candidatus Paceibacterota bacterium]
MKIQVSCTQISESTEKKWVESLFVRHNAAPLNKNPLAFQNKWMSEYFSERVPEAVMADVQRLKEINGPAGFEEVVVHKYCKAQEKESADQNLEFDYNIDINVEDINILPTPVRFLKSYYSKLPAPFVETLTNDLTTYKDSVKVPAPLAFILGVMHDSGVRVPVDHAKALFFYKLARKQKYPYGYYTLFDIYSRCYATYGLAKNQEKALRQIVKLLINCVYCSDSWISPKFAGDSAYAYLSVGFAHLDVYAYSCDYVRQLLEKSKDEGLKLVLKHIIAVEKKETDECFKSMESLAGVPGGATPFVLIKLADDYLAGTGGITKNQDKARELLQRVVDTKQEDSPFFYYACEMLAYILDVKGEYAHAQELYVKAASYGLSYSLKRMGISYALGLEAEQNTDLAQKYLMKAAALGCSDAYLVLLEMYVYLKELRPRAWQFLESLAPLLPLLTSFEQDCYYLYKAIMLEKGMGTPSNYPGAITIYSTLPKKDFPVALYRLGKVYERKNNMIQAQQYYEDCFNNYMDIIKNWTQPHSSTYIRIGKLYMEGKGCEQNRYKAREIMEKSLTIKCCPTIPCLKRKQKVKALLEKLCLPQRETEEMKS